MIADRIVTINDPAIIGKAPNDLALGSHFVLNKKSVNLTPSTKNVDSPF